MRRPRAPPVDFKAAQELDGLWLWFYGLCLCQQAYRGRQCRLTLFRGLGLPLPLTASFRLLVQKRSCDFFTIGRLTRSQSPVFLLSSPGRGPWRCHALSCLMSSMRVFTPCICLSLTAQDASWWCGRPVTVEWGTSRRSDGICIYISMWSWDALMATRRFCSKSTQTQNG